MTPAVEQLEQAGIGFTTISYEHLSGGQGYGMEAAEKTGVDPDQVFKTLLVVWGDARGRQHHGVGVVPVSMKLSLKATASALGQKRVQMCDPADAERVTGYVVGGISPFGQRKRLPTVLDETALLFDRIYVSGGQRGFEIGLAPEDLVTVLDATTADISTTRAS